MLKGLTAVVTGGSRGIGAAIVRKLSSLGANVAVLYAGNREKAEALCRELEGQFGGRLKAYQCDVSDFEAVKATVGEIRKDFGGVQLLVNNAGIARDGLIATMREADFDAVVATDLKGAFNLIRHCTPLMLRGKYGRIVNVSSVAGLMGNAGQANYAAAKAGLVGLTKATARELAPRGITCNAVAPGFVATEMTEALPESAETLSTAVPLGRMARPEEIAEAVAFLLTADYITGEVLRVDGGIAM